MGSNARSVTHSGYVVQEPGLGRAFLCLECWLVGARAGWLMLRFAQIFERCSGRTMISWKCMLFTVMEMQLSRIVVIWQILQ